MDTPSDLGNPALSIEANQAVIPSIVIDSLARCLLPALQAYYKDPAGQAAFEDWKRQQNQNT